jgi:hypothetical protein
MAPRCEHALFLHKCFFDFVFLLVCDGWQTEQHVCIKFCMKLSKSATKTLEMHHKAFAEHSLCWTEVFKWHSCFRAGRVSAEDEHSGQQSTSKTTQNFEKIQELIHKHHH